jgi:hypothetical protein
MEPALHLLQAEQLVTRDEELLEVGAAEGVRHCGELRQSFEGRAGGAGEGGSLVYWP